MYVYVFAYVLIFVLTFVCIYEVVTEVCESIILLANTVFAQIASSNKNVKRSVDTEVTDGACAVPVVLVLIDSVWQSKKTCVASKPEKHLINIESRKNFTSPKGIRFLWQNI